MAKYTGDVPSVAHAELIHSVIQRVATGPELSKNISYEESRSVSNALLQGAMDPVQAAVFLIGLRMKRETDDELKGLVDALNDATTHVKAQCDEVVVMSDPYNGFNRTIHSSLFVLPVLAACGVSAYSHGVELVGPKYGVTHHQIIKTLGGNPLNNMEQLAEKISSSSVGWGYADQSVFCKPLSDLIELRAKIIKRPALSTTEVMLTPVTGQQQTHLITGYVHKPYREIYAMLARHLNIDSLLLIRGTEGGVIPSFKAKAHFVRYHGSSEAQEHDVDLEPLGLARDYRAEDIPDTTPTPPQSAPFGMKWDNNSLAQLCADKGIAALNGEAGAVHDAAVLGAALTLWHIGKSPSLADATDAARQAISSGEALQRLKTGLASR